MKDPTMEPELPDLPKQTAWNCQLVMNGSDGIVEGWFTTNAENDPDDIPNGWDARIERVAIFTADQLRSYGLQCANAQRERCASLLLALKPDAIRLALGEMTAQEMRSVLAVLKWQAAAIRGTDSS